MNEQFSHDGVQRHVVQFPAGRRRHGEGGFGVEALAISVIALSLMHTSSWPGPRLKQRFEFGVLGARGSCGAADRPEAVRGLNELAHLAGISCAGIPASVPCRSKETKNDEKDSN